MKALPEQAAKAKNIQPQECVRCNTQESDDLACMFQYKQIYVAATSLHAKLYTLAGCVPHL